MVLVMHPIEHLRYVARTGGDVSQALLTQEAAYALGDLGADSGGLVMACRKLLQRHGMVGSMWTLAARVCTASDPEAAANELIKQMRSDQTAAHVLEALQDARQAPERQALERQAPEQQTPGARTVCVLGWPDFANDWLGDHSAGYSDSHSAGHQAAPHQAASLEVRVLDAYGEGAGLARNLGGNNNSDSDADNTSKINSVAIPLTGMAQAIATSDVLLIEAIAAGPDTVLATTGSYAAAAVARSFGVEVWAVVRVGRALPAEIFDTLLAKISPDQPWEAEEEAVPLSLITHLARPDGVRPLPANAKASAQIKSDCPVATELLTLN